MSELFATDDLRILVGDGPYPAEAYVFVQEGLGHTAQQLEAETEYGWEFDRHVTGQELCMGLRDLAIQRYGMLAGTVMSCWSIHETMDLGRIVYAMIGAGLLRQQAEDSIDDFVDVYDFREAFDVRGMESLIGTSKDT